ncbi:Tad domain-containing protein [Orrella sp. 11846]|uniref:Tad domain-containing protein n=1 Tax=Orrella sp. 11846 TaxID=3409913 RepID=UPI003B5C3273
MKHIVKQFNPRQCERPTGEQGAVLTIVAIVMVALLGFSGLVIDFGYSYTQKARMQALADSLALACGQFECVAQPPGENSALFSPLMATFSGQGQQQTVNVDPQTTCPGNSQAHLETQCTKVTIHRTWDTFFIRLFGISQLSTQASA